MTDVQPAIELPIITVTPPVDDTVVGNVVGKVIDVETVKGTVGAEDVVVKFIEAEKKGDKLSDVVPLTKTEILTKLLLSQTGGDIKPSKFGLLKNSVLSPSRLKKREDTQKDLGTKYDILRKEIEDADNHIKNHGPLIKEEDIIVEKAPAPVSPGSNNSEVLSVKADIIKGSIEISNTAKYQAKKKELVEKLKDYYNRYNKVCDLENPKLEDVHNREKHWRAELITVGTIWSIVAISFIMGLVNNSGIGDFIVTLVFALVFLVSPFIGMYMDKRYCKFHEMSVFKIDKLRQWFVTWPLTAMCLFFGFSSGAEIMATTVNAILVIPFALLFSLTIGGFYHLIFKFFARKGVDKLDTLSTPLTKEYFTKIPSLEECVEVGLIKKFKRRANPVTGKDVESRKDFLLNNRSTLLKGMMNDVVGLQLFSLSRGPTWFRCMVTHLVYEIGVELLAASWFYLRLFAVSCIMAVGGGVGLLGQQILYSVNQKRRLSRLDYGNFDPPHIQLIKAKLQYNLKTKYDLDIPNLTELVLPQLTLPELLLLIPDLPHLPNLTVDLPELEQEFPWVNLEFPYVTTNVMGTDLSFPNIVVPNFTGYRFDLPFNLPKEDFAGMDSPALQIVDLCQGPQAICSQYMTPLFTEMFDDLIGAFLSIFFAAGEISLLTDEAMLYKEQKVIQDMHCHPVVESLVAGDKPVDQDGNEEAEDGDHSATASGTAADSSAVVDSDVDHDHQNLGINGPIFEDIIEEADGATARSNSKTQTVGGNAGVEDVSPGDVSFNADQFVDVVGDHDELSASNLEHSVALDMVPLTENKPAEEV